MLEAAEICSPVRKSVEESCAKNYVIAILTVKHRNNLHVCCVMKKIDVEWSRLNDT